MDPRLQVSCLTVAHPSLIFLDGWWAKGAWNSKNRSGLGCNSPNSGDSLEVDTVALFFSYCSYI